MEQKIKQDEIHIGQNIRRIRLEKGIGQTALVRQLQLEGISMTRGNAGENRARDSAHPGGAAARYS